MLIVIFFISLLISLIITTNTKKSKFVTRNGVSQLGGVAIWFSFLTVSLLALISKIQQVAILKEILGIFVCSTAIFLIGLVDDRSELAVPVKFLAQLVITLIVIFLGVRTQIVGIGFYGNILVTLLWIVGITNAFNHLDIVDGLSAGIAFISTLTFLIFSIITFNIPIALTLAALAGGTLGFFRYNFPVGSIYMGNAGSHFLGFVLSTLSIMISYATIEKRIALIVPILILGFPIFDTVFVMWMRFLKHKPVWLKSNDHLALRLISLGFPKKKAVIYMFILAIIFCLSSIFVLCLSNTAVIILLCSLFILCCYIALKMKRARIDE